MPTLAQLIDDEKWDEAKTYCRTYRSEVIPEIKAILAKRYANNLTEAAKESETKDAAYACLRQIRTQESALLLAQGFGNGGGYNSIYGLIEDPRPEVYPILKAKLRPPENARDKNLLLTMAQISVPVEQRVADIRPYLEAKYYGVRQGAVLGLALLDDPGSMERMAYELGTKWRDGKQYFLWTFYHFRAWRIPKFVPVLIPVLNDPQPLEDIGVRQYLPGGVEQAMTPEEQRYCRARDYALNIIAKTLKLDLPFKIEEHVTYTKEQRELVKQKLRDLGYTVTDAPYPVTPAD